MSYAHIFTTPARLPQVAQNGRNRRRHSRHYSPMPLEETFEVIRPSPSYPVLFIPEYNAIPRSQTQEAIKDISDSIEDVQIHYARLQQMVEQQTGYVELQEQVLKRLESETSELDEEIERVKVSLRETEAKIAEDRLQIKTTIPGERNTRTSAVGYNLNEILGHRRTFSRQTPFGMEYSRLVKKLFNV